MMYYWVNTHATIHYMDHHNYNPQFIHHSSTPFDGVVREFVFGMEDGMVSTLGALTGIAIGSNQQQTVILAGCVIIAVESISMGIGSYLSNRSEKEVESRKLQEEKSEIEQYPKEEHDELIALYRRDGWPEKLAGDMAHYVSQHPNLMLKEMAYRELGIQPSLTPSSVKGALMMFASYVVGGLIPLTAYILQPIHVAIPISVLFTLTGLFALGAFTTAFTKQPFLKSGLRMLLIGGVALVVGLVVGSVVGR